MKLIIECNEEQAQLIVQSLEESFRFRMGQENYFLEYILNELFPKKIEKEQEKFDKDFESWMHMRDDAEIVCKSLMDIIYGKYYDRKLTVDTHNISDIWNVLRHEMYLETNKNPSPWDVRCDEPYRLGQYDLPKVKVEK